MQKRIAFLIFLFTVCSSELKAQNLTLTINGTTEVETKTIDSLDYKKTHSDYASITQEVNILQKRLFRLGYIESKLTSKDKVNDSAIVFNFQLNIKYDTLHIYYNPKVISKKIINLITSKTFDDHFSIAFTEAERVLNFINTQITNEGYPFSKIKLSEIKTERQQNLNR
ncbi:hypothetical protein N7U66_08960 [Lacinutrix neustonica]|uniref:POTRA domain-containing protein n=1 Tax=Lacinutrix neustonica TaxID=2980107 RepID=A0A9E8MZ63_9FLAO|nr:hypothetical protein [Lacinutrix neustonica]WAC03579.1 hypothetical protein N7U66_08960 [Lacinutrix neustonica]